MAKTTLRKYKTSARITGSPIIVGIKLSDEYLTAGGGEASGNYPASPILLSASSNNKSDGFKPRGWNLKPAVGSGASVFLPVCDEAKWKAKKPGDAVTLGKRSMKISTLRDEQGYFD